MEESLKFTTCFAENQDPPVGRAHLRGRLRLPGLPQVAARDHHGRGRELGVPALLEQQDQHLRQGLDPVHPAHPDRGADGGGGGEDRGAGDIRGAARGVLHKQQLVGGRKSFSN